jgi:hypothetical protein
VRYFFYLFKHIDVEYQAFETALISGYKSGEILIKLPRDGKIQEAKTKIMAIINHAKLQPNNSQLIVYADVDPM